MSDRAPVFEAAGYSLFGPTALNIAAPDEGNVHMLAHIASDEQKQQFLAPLAAGDVRSAFAMTEPAPRCRRRSQRAEHTRREGLRWLEDQRPQALHHRRRRCRILHHHGPHLG